MARLLILRKGEGWSQDIFDNLFGHSLSRADYPYFESIFSTVDLYNGHTSLVFLYSNYAKGVRESEVTKVLALLDYYGSSLGIVGRSNNLAHKLMLEGRLVVREI